MPTRSSLFLERRSKARERDRFRALRQQVEIVAHAGEWLELIALTNDLQPTDSQLIVLRTIAALEISDEPAIASCIELCAKGLVPPNIALAVASRLNADERAVEAWELISRLHLPPGRNLLVLLNRLLPKSPDLEIRAAVLAKLEAVRHAVTGMPAGLEQRRMLELATARYWFPQAGRPEPEAGGRFRLTLINGGRVASRHEVEYRNRMNRFERRVTTSETPCVLEFKDVFVNQVGQIWQEDGTFIRSKDRPLPPDWASRAVDGLDEAVLGADGTRGFFHWYAERLPTLAWRFAPDAPDFPILLPAHAQGFKEETLRLLGIPADRIYRIGDVFHCRRLLLSEARISTVAWSRFRDMYERLAAAAAAEHRQRTPDMIYISRRDSGRRPLTNEQEVEDRLLGLGIVPLVFSELSLAAQIATVRNATFVVGSHGAGLSHIVAHASGLRIFEIHPAQSGSHNLRLTMVRLSRVRGHDHTLWLEPINPVTREWTAQAARIGDAVETAMHAVDASPGQVVGERGRPSEFAANRPAEGAASPRPNA
jgi:hypothetical protein